MKKVLVVVFLLLGITGVKSQASLGFVTHATPGLSDTLIMNSNITYGVTVQNTGTQPLMVNYKVYIAVMDTSSFFPDLVDSVLVNNNSMQPGDSALVTITHNVDQTKFVDGNNTVVIWPAAPGYQTSDTIFKDVFVITFESINELSDNQLIVYPNPATDYLYIQSEFVLERVRIYDLEGKLVSTQQSRMIDISSYQSGLYFIEVETAEGKLLRKKLMVE